MRGCCKLVTNKRKKVVKYRGHTTHGGGHRKKRRGSGSRGGKGNAGTGKKAGHKKYGVVLGQTGFLPRRNKAPVRSVNLGYFTSFRLDKLLSEGKISKEGQVFVINLTDLGFDKLLGMGTVNFKLKLHVSQCSASAAEKVKVAGGEVVTSVVVSKESSE